MADPKQRLKTISIKLSFILRHGAQKIGLPIRSDGFVLVRELLGVNELCALSTSVDEIHDVVRDCVKQRFEITTIEGELMIRAVQGHSIASIDASELLRELTLEDVCASDEYSVVIHGTRLEFVESIMTGSSKTAGSSTAGGNTKATGKSVAHVGLSRCSRNHVHLSLGFPVGFDGSRWENMWHQYDTSGTSKDKISTPDSVSVFDSLMRGSRAAVVSDATSSAGCGAVGKSASATCETIPIAMSGIRCSTTAILFIDIRRAMGDGIKFFRSSNDVILTPGLSDTGVLPAQYVCDIITRRQPS
jgi:RNA:NAD 2'-phosphotransferase (TPT1/KptA family)